MDDAAARLSRFFLVQLGINTGVGIVTAVGLYFIGLPSPLLWGIVAGLARFVPYLGSYVAAAGPVLLAAAVEPGWVKAISVTGPFLITEPLIGQFIEPLFCTAAAPAFLRFLRYSRQSFGDRCGALFT